VADRSTVLSGARRVDADGVVDDAWVRFAGGVVESTGTGAPPPADETEHLDGAWLTPGFVELHVHGGGGHSAEDGAEAIRGALALHRAHGTTRSLVSLTSGPLDRLAGGLAAVAEVAAHEPGLLGAHLEGPFLAPSRHGAHDPEHLRNPDAAAVDRLLDAGRGVLRQVTLAPELPGGLDAVRAFAAAGVTVAVGHTEADLELTARAFDAGASLLTHAFNAMPGLHHRAPGPVGGALADPRITLELVLDGRHVHPAAARVLFAAAPGRIALVTDAMAAAGAGDGSYRLGGLDVEVSGGVAVVAGTGTLAGSTLTLDSALRTAVAVLGVDPAVAVGALTATPARALGLDDRFGRLAPGYAADAVVLDRDWRVRGVWADGRRIG
jgi:N-acetylglucosamine-6-phosphate deacetylase